MKWAAIIAFSILFFSIVCLSCSKKSEKERYQMVIAKKDLSAAYNFKMEFPDSKQNIDSIIHELEYQKLISSSEISDYIIFKNKYPQSIYLNIILSRLEELDWRKTRLNPSVNSIQSFMLTYPNSAHYEEAENWINVKNNSGTFTDGRDGQTYSWQKFGNQIWMTQNLNYKMVQSCPRLNKNRNEIREAGRAYTQEVFWKACPEGWDVPKLEDWYDLIFELNGKYGISIPNYSKQIYCFFDGSSMGLGGEFYPYLNFSHADYRKDVNDCGMSSHDGANYWTSTYISEGIAIKVMPNIPIAISWGVSLEDEKPKSIDFINIGSEFDDAFPIRCIKKERNIGSSPVSQTPIYPLYPSKSDTIIISSTENRRSNLPLQGLYYPQGRSLEEDNYFLLIKYVGTKMFVLLTETPVSYYANIMFTNFPISKSKDEKSFTLFDNSNTKIAELIFRDNGNLILKHYHNTTNIEFQIITGMKFQK